MTPDVREARRIGPLKLRVDGPGPGENAMTDTVLLTSEGALATLTLNRPKVLNPLNGDVVDGLAGALDRFDAAAALALGLVNWVVRSASLAERSRVLVERLTQGPAEAQAATKQLLNRSLDRTLEAQLQAELEDFAYCAASSDFPEAVAAFVEKRASRFGHTEEIRHGRS